MSIKKVTILTCDRCNTKREVGESQQSELSQKVELLVGGDPYLTFEDLCPRCKSRVQVLINNLAMAKDDKSTAKKEGVGE